MKKIVALLMASAMAASLAACGGSAQSSEATSTAPAESTAAESTATDGKKYEGVELTMWSMWSAGEVRQMQFRPPLTLSRLKLAHTSTSSGKAAMSTP